MDGQGVLRQSRRSLHLGLCCLLAAVAVAVAVAPVRSAPAAEPAPGWQDAVQRQIAEDEYQLTWQGRTALPDLESAWQAPNRAHGFRTYFTDSGIRVVPRTEETPSWEWGLTLTGWGRSGSTESELIESAQPSVDGARIEYDRGGLVEWYVNDGRGLEQGFTIAAPPRALAARASADEASGTEVRGGSSTVRIDLALAGTLGPIVSEDGQAIDFATPSGARVLRYGALLVRDAVGRELPAWMEGFASPGTAGGIRIVFEDTEAVYPVIVDPLATGPAWTGEGDFADSRYGSALGTAGDVNGDGYSDIVVGAYDYDNGSPDQGRAFVYYGSPSGPSTTPSRTLSSNYNGGNFGWSVATAGDVNGDGYSDVIVGANEYTNGQPREGRAFVYMGSAAGLPTTPAWIAESNDQGGYFGHAVATAGDVNGDGYSDVIVGCYQCTNVQLAEGRAFLYLGSSSGLSPAPAWSGESNQPGAQYGAAVATAGDVNGDGFSDVIVGANYYENGQTDEGAAFLYMGSIGGLATTPVKVYEWNVASARFGISVGTAGDTNGDGYADVVIGAFNYTNDVSLEGRAFLFLGAAGGLGTGATWITEGNQANSSYGRAVGTAGDVNGDGYADVIVSADYYDAGQSDEGRAYVYFGSASGLSTIPAWFANGGQQGINFGVAAATAGDVNGDGYSDVLVGMYQYTNGQAREGGARLYLGSASTLAAAPGWTSEGGQASALHGYSVKTAGDVNGDGYSDVIVGIPLLDGGDSDEGRAEVFLGSAAGLAFTPAWATESNRIGSQYGSSVGTAGDVNGDGYSDVVVGAPYWVNGQGSEGRAYVYLGSSAGLATTPAWTVESDQSNASYGWSVGTAGDVNGDGYSDLAVGALSYSHGQLNEGSVWVYHGSATGLPVNASWFGERNQGGASFGYSVGTAGDVDADGFSDLIVGAPFFDNGQSNEGRAYVYKGSPSGLGTLPIWTTESNQADANYGRSVGTAGDVNGDGFSDVVVGAPQFDNGETDEGRAQVYLGGLSGVAIAPVWTREGDQAGARLGTSVGTAGDVNGDGLADVIVGADGYDNGQTDEGLALVHHGSVSGVFPATAWTVESNQAGAQLGFSAAAAGDVNGDGFGDVIVGAPYFDDLSVTDRGGAFLYYGNGGRSLSTRPFQRRVGTSIPIGRLGTSDETDRFRLDLLGRTPFGRGFVKLEWEVKGLRAPFDRTQTSAAALWSDTGTGTAALGQVVSDPSFTGGAALHWRVRLRYRTPTSPFQGWGRWMTIPSGGWNETMLRTSFLPAGRVPDGMMGSPLLVAKVGGGQIRLDWGGSCITTDTDYEVYEGTIGGTFATHAPRLCTTSGARTATLAPTSGARYYLVVPRNAQSEGSYGMTSAGAERPVSTAACLHRQFEGCQSTCSGGRFPEAECDSNQDCPGACTGASAGTSCLDSSVCLGRCGSDPNIPCVNGMDPRCRFCLNDHSIPCTSSMQCQIVGGPCSGGGGCTGQGSCVNPVPGTCEAP